MSATATATKTEGDKATKTEEGSKEVVLAAHEIAALRNYLAASREIATIGAERDFWQRVMPYMPELRQAGFFGTRLPKGLEDTPLTRLLIAIATKINKETINLRDEVADKDLKAERQKTRARMWALGEFRRHNIEIEDALRDALGRRTAIKQNEALVFAALEDTVDPDDPDALEGFVESYLDDHPDAVPDTEAIAEENDPLEEEGDNHGEESQDDLRTEADEITITFCQDLDKQTEGKLRKAGFIPVEEDNVWIGGNTPKNRALAEELLDNDLAEDIYWK